MAWGGKAVYRLAIILAYKFLDYSLLFDIINVYMVAC